MLYKLLEIGWGHETQADENGNYTKVITLGLVHLEGLEAGQGVSEDIEVTSHNDLRGYEVDQQRKTEIINFCTENSIQIPDEFWEHSN